MGSAAAGLTFKLLKQHAGAVQQESKVFYVESARIGSRKRERRDNTVKWEEIPLTNQMDSLGGDAELSGEKADDKRHRSTKHRIIKTLKILLPHIGLTIILLCYVAAGAAVLQQIELDTDREHRVKKVKEIADRYEQIMNSSWTLCKNKTVHKELFESEMKKQLLGLSTAHEYDERQPDENFTLNSSEINSRWTFPAAILYSLTILTTTGYDVLTPRTNGGKLFSVFFGLVGIPLMFITAADIGKFLSDVFLKSWAKFRDCRKLVWSRLTSYYVRLKRYMLRNKNDKSDGELAIGRKGDDTSVTSDDDKSSSNQFDDDPLAMFDDQTGQIELPVFAYFGLILTYCSLGGLLFTQWEHGPLWTFIHAFHFSFNTITTISLGTVVVRNLVYMCLIVVYVIVGLSVVTMCVDLASSHLKILFSRIHYFGRKMRGARSAFANMSDDIREAMRLIHTVRKHKPDKKITIDDLRLAAMELNAAKHVGLGLRPYVPNGIYGIKYVDDEDLSHRSRSLTGSGISMNLSRINSDPNIHI